MSVPTNELPETTQRLRVLLIAEAANPEWVSVPLEGWSHSQAIARLVDAHVVTQVRNRAAMVRAGLVEGRDFTAIDTEAIVGKAYALASRLRGGAGKGWTTVTALNALTYYYFEHLLWKRFADRLARGQFDLVHRLTPLSPTVPSLMANWCRRRRLPFILGPLNGGLPWPADFDRERRKEREWLSYVRGAYRLLPGYTATRTFAAALIIASRDTFIQVPERFHDKCVYIPENAIDTQRFTTVVDRPLTRPLRVAFVGRLVPYKGADMLLQAAAPLVRSGDVQVDIIGDGPEMPALRAIVEQQHLEQGVRLDGWVQHQHLQTRLAESDVFGFPSVREFGGAVVLEAMAAGLVPVVADYGGPGELVTDATGYRVQMGTREQIVARFREVLAQIVRHPHTIRAMGQRARDRVLRHFTWDAKARQVLEVYRWVLRRRGKPDFGMPLPDEPIQNGEAEARYRRAGTDDFCS